MIMSTANLPSASPTAGKPVGHQGKLKAVNLNFDYGAYQALHDITLDVPANRITALIGPSGCGKSTFLRILNRIHETIHNYRLEGEVLLDGEDIRGVDVTTLRRRVGMVFQRPNPFPKSIADNIAYGLRINGMATHKEMPDKVEQSLRRGGPRGEGQDKPDEFALG